MTRLLERAYTGIGRLAPEAQDTIAVPIVDELDSEDEWERQFNKSATRLSQIAREALAEHLAGNSLPLDPEAL